MKMVASFDKHVICWGLFYLIIAIYILIIYYFYFDFLSELFVIKNI